MENTFYYTFRRVDVPTEASCFLRGLLSTPSLKTLCELHKFDLNNDLKNLVAHFHKKYGSGSLSGDTWSVHLKGDEDLQKVLTSAEDAGPLLFRTEDGKIRLTPERANAYLTWLRIAMLEYGPQPAGPCAYVLTPPDADRALVQIVAEVILNAAALHGPSFTIPASVFRPLLQGRNTPARDLRTALDVLKTTTAKYRYKPTVAWSDLPALLASWEYKPAGNRGRSGVYAFEVASVFVLTTTKKSEWKAKAWGGMQKLRRQKAKAEARDAKKPDPTPAPRDTYDPVFTGRVFFDAASGLTPEESALARVIETLILNTERAFTREDLGWLPEGRFVASIKKFAPKSKNSKPVLTGRTLAGSSTTSMGLLHDAGLLAYGEALNEAKILGGLESLENVVRAYGGVLRGRMDHEWISTESAARLPLATLAREVSWFILFPEDYQERLRLRWEQQTGFVMNTGENQERDDLADRFARWRERDRVSLREVARLLKVDASRVCRWEKSGRIPWNHRTQVEELIARVAFCVS